MLNDKVAVVYGGGGFVGGAVARSFAAEGARVFLAGRTSAKLEKVAAAITDAGGKAHVAVLDTLDEEAVDQHADDVAASAGRIDIAFNAVTFGDVQGALLIDMPVSHATQPVNDAMRSHFLTVRANARHMASQRSGVIMTCTGYGAPSPELGATMVAWNVLEGLYRQWACELGSHGIRVAWLRTGGFHESILGAADYTSIYNYSDGATVAVADTVTDDSVQEMVEALEADTMLGRLPTLAEAGASAVYLASDHARGVTATAINLTSGAMPD
nr:SDR family oxidoreductase [Phytoactinopolyspora mesophila]